MQMAGQAGRPQARQEIPGAGGVGDAPGLLTPGFAFEIGAQRTPG